MTNRIQAELDLLRTRYPDLEFRETGQWVLLSVFPLPPGWKMGEENVSAIPLAFKFPDAQYPQNPFYGFCVPSGLRPAMGTLSNFNDPAPAPPPFDGKWAFFSGNPKPWQPGLSVESGSNVLSWVRSIGQRLREAASAEEQ